MLQSRTETTIQSESLLDAARRYHALGLSVIPCEIKSKRPCGQATCWSQFQKERVGQAALDSFFEGSTAVGLVCGAISGNLFCVDFDFGREAFPAWKNAVGDEALLGRLVMETSQSGGLHAFYRTEKPCGGNEQLAFRNEFREHPDGMETRGGKEVPVVHYKGKKSAARRLGDGRWLGRFCVVESRGEGGFVVVQPSPGYAPFPGSAGLDDLPILTMDQHERLLCAAKSVSDGEPLAGQPARTRKGSDWQGETVAEAFARDRRAVRDLLERHGWAYFGDSPKGETWTRPGKCLGVSGTLMHDSPVFYCFTSSTCLEPSRGYSPLQLYAALECNGDQSEAARLLYQRGYGERQKTRRATAEGGTATTPEARKESSVATSLVRVALASCELRRTPSGDVLYAAVGGDNLALDGGRFGQWLAATYYASRGVVPSAGAVSDAARVLSQMAHESKAEALHLRVAVLEGRIYLDLADEARRVVEVGADGWSVRADPPVRFARPPGMLPLPMPERGAGLGGLRAMFNLRSDGDWALVLAWLACTLAGRPYPILSLHGPAGSAKSTMACLLRSIVDPSRIARMSVPRDPRDLHVAAHNVHVLSLDNVSAVPQWLGDLLCCLSTGQADATRALYTNSEVSILEAARPVILNGITSFVAAPDLASRTLAVTLDSIPGERRRTESDVMRAFERAHPAVLGALLDAASSGLRNLPSLALDRMPRMADAAKWAVACEDGLGLPAGAILDALDGSQAELQSVALEADPLGQPLLGLLAEKEWSGTASELLCALNARVAEEQRKDKAWPKNHAVLGNRLRRLVPALASIGWEVRFEATREARLIVFSRESAAGKPLVRTTKDAEDEFGF